MEDLCNLAMVIAGRSKVRDGMFNLTASVFKHTNVPFKPIDKPFAQERVREQPKGTPRELDMQLNPAHKHAFHIACRAYGKETQSGLLYTLESLPKRLVSII